MSLPDEIDAMHQFWAFDNATTMHCPWRQGSTLLKCPLCERNRKSCLTLRQDQTPLAPVAYSNGLDIPCQIAGSSLVGQTFSLNAFGDQLDVPGPAAWLETLEGIDGASGPRWLAQERPATFSRILVA